MDPQKFPTKGDDDDRNMIIGDTDRDTDTDIGR